MWRKITTENEARKKHGQLVTLPYDLLVRPEDKPVRENTCDFVSNKGKRQDGRSSKEARKIYMKCGVVEDARGSAYVEMGGTKVIAAASGPVEMPQTNESEDRGFLNCQVKFSQFSCKTRDQEEELDTEIDTVTDGLNRALEPAVIKEELDNVQLNVVVTVVESDGGVVAACVIAASLAIANGRIPMCDLVASSTLAVLPGGVFLTDPTSEEEQFALARTKDNQSHGLLNLSYMASSDQVTDLVVCGKLEVGSVVAQVATLKEECSKIYAKMQQVLRNNVKEMVDIIIANNNQACEEVITNTVRQQLAKLST